MVLVAIILPVLILLGAIVIDVGDWSQQSRHLQLQADAGALAGAQNLTTSNCSDAAVLNAARQYSGTAGGGSPVFNQLNGVASTIVSELFNSQAYPSQAQPPPRDPTPMTGSPCNDGFIDVKMTEGGTGSGLPLPFVAQAAQAVGINMGLNAHARVSILQEAGGTGFSPLGLADPAPVAATAYFIDESNPPPAGTPLATLRLTNAGTNGLGQTIWSSSGATVPVTINHPNVGVIIALSGNPQNSTCGQQYVNCFDLAPGPSLVHIQGYSMAGTGSWNKPLARSVILNPTGSCTDAYFAPNPPCSFQIDAALDLGASSTMPPPGVSVKAVVAGTSYPLTYSSSSGTTEHWKGTASIASGTGSNQIDLSVSCDPKATNSACTGAKNPSPVTISDVQRSYAETAADSGPIQSAYVLNSSGTPDQNSFEVCEAQDNFTCTYNLGVTITVAGGLANTTTSNAPMYTLNYGNGTTASQTGAVTCPPASTGQFVITITQGCQGTYICNSSVSSVANCVSDPTCVNTNPLSGKSPPPPADCAQTNPGVSQGQVKQGVTARITTPSNGSKYYCANNWPTGNFVLPPSNDSRYITMFIMPYGAFSGHGQAYYPIEAFGEFYVMGWSGDPCASDPPPPGGGNGQGQIWGYFVQPVVMNPGSIGGSRCTPTVFGPCVAVLTQ